MSSWKRSLSCPNKQLKPFCSLWNNHVLKDWFFLFLNNMVVPWGNLSIVILGTWLFLEEQLKPLFLLEHDCSSKQLKPLFPWEHGFLWKFVLRQLILKSCQRAICFHPFCLWMKKNSRIFLKLGPLGCIGNFNHCINFLFWKYYQMGHSCHCENPWVLFTYSLKSIGTK